MNKLGINLSGRIVLLAPSTHGGSEEERRFLCENGFGLMPFTHGSTITGTHLLTNKVMTIDGDTDIDCLWVPTEVHRAAEPPEVPEVQVAEPAVCVESFPTPAVLPPAPPPPPPPTPTPYYAEEEKAPEVKKPKAKPKAEPKAVEEAVPSPTVEELNQQAEALALNLATLPEAEADAEAARLEKDNPALFSLVKDKLAALHFGDEPGKNEGEG
jgi:outer membrane biosynthesis protein TonB